MKTTQCNFLLLLAIGGACFLPSRAVAQGGVPLWTNRYNGPGNGTDQINAMAVDTNGNVYVTGHSFGDGGHGDDFATIKYSGAGVPLWTNRYRGPGSFPGDDARSIAVDGSGNVYVTGASANSFMFASPDYATIKYSGAGVPLWTNRYGTAADTDTPTKLVTDGSGNVYVTGYSAGSGSGSDYLTIKYSSGGAPLWTNRYNGPANSQDQALFLALDGDTNVYVTGTSTGSGTGKDFATIKYSSAGTPLWTNRYDGPGNGDDTAKAVAVAGSGNVYVTGGSLGSGTSNDFATVAYSSAGLPLWTNRYDGPGNGDDLPLAVAVDGSGIVYVTGYSTGNGSSYDYATIAYSSTGAHLWTNRYSGPGILTDIPRAVVVDAGGIIYVTGGPYFVTIAYSSDGTALWTQRHYGSANAMAVDGNGNLYVAGYGYENGNDYATIKYAPTVLLHLENTGNAAILNWINAAFGLQSAPSASGTFTNVPGATSPYTNSVTDSQQFFRLKAN